MDTDAPALSIVDLEVEFPDPAGGRVRALALEHLEVGRGAIVSVEGASGSGKTTLLHAIAGIVPATRGRLEVMGTSLVGLGERARDRLRARHVGYVFQTFNLLPHLTALENVALGMAFRPRGGEMPLAAAREALERVGLADRLAHRPTQLSVGQRQRVAIARAMAGRPDLVLADEPTSSLDSPNAVVCLDLLVDFARDCEAALLLVTHDPDVLARYPARTHLAAACPSTPGDA